MANKKYLGCQNFDLVQVLTFRLKSVLLLVLLEEWARQKCISMAANRQDTHISSYEKKLNNRGLLLEISLLSS